MRAVRLRIFWSGTQRLDVSCQMAAACEHFLSTHIADLKLCHSCCCNCNFMFMSIHSSITCQKLDRGDMNR